MLPDKFSDLRTPRIPGPEKADLYRAAAQLRDNCLLSGGSYFKGKDYPLWTPENLKDFIENSYVHTRKTEGTYWEKLERDSTKWLGDVEPERRHDCLLLMAEVHMLYALLFKPSAKVFSKYTQRVLDWHSEIKVEITEKDVGDWKENLIKPGSLQAYIYPHVPQCADLARAILQLEPSERKELLTNPWKFDEFLENEYKVSPPVLAEGYKNVLFMFQHIVFPDVFERILTQSDRDPYIEYWVEKLGIEALGEALGSETQKLFQIRQALIQQYPANKYEQIDPYIQPFDVWKKERKQEPSIDVQEDKKYEGLKRKRNIVLHGPPGTGKTHMAIELARHMVGKEKEQCIHRLQLHPSLGYADFIQSLHIDPEKHATVYRDGYFVRLCKEISKDSNQRHVLILDEINRTNLSSLLGEAFSALEYPDEPIDLTAFNPDDREPRQLVVPKNLYIIATMNTIDHSVEPLDFALRRRFLWYFVGYEEETLRALLDDEGFSHAAITELHDAIVRINDKICDHSMLGNEYQLGACLFKDASLRDGRIDFADIAKHVLRPLITEYLRGVYEGSELDKQCNEFLAVFSPDPNKRTDSTD